MTAGLATLAPADATAAPAPPTFAPAQAAAAGPRPSTVAIGDLNDDGRPDLVTANPGSDSVTTLTKNAAGDGYTTTTGAGSTGDRPSSVAIGDLNGDGRLDIATSDFGSRTVSVLLKNAAGNGYTTTTTDRNTTGTFPGSIVIGDLNGDGRPDLATANEGSNNVTVLLQNAAGNGYTATTTGGNTTGRNPRSVAIGDLNGDGRPDLATADALSDTVSVLTKNATDAGYTTTTVAGGRGPFSIAIGDLNSDGRPEIATANIRANTVSVLTKNATNGFTTLATGTTGNGPGSVAIGDFNGDGRPDLATANTGSNTVSVLTKDTTGTGYTTTNAGTAGSSPNAIAIGDLSGDGRPDLATADGDSDAVSFLVNATAAPLSSSTPTAFGAQPIGTVSGAQTVTVTNDSTTSTRVGAVRITGANRDDFVMARDDCTDQDLSPRGSCEVAVRFAPAAPVTPASRTAQLTVQTPDGFPSTPVALTGTATELPAGPPGSQGSSGAAGSQGAPGAAGAPGPQGATGPQGQAGAPGATGAQGATGATGTPGTNGSPGATGNPGATGAKGATGAQGEPGLPGPTGPVGLRGPRGSGGLGAFYRCEPSTRRRSARCVVEVTRATGTRTITVKITRGGKTVASGRRTLTARQRQRIEVFPRGTAKDGRYRITITIRQRGRKTQTLASTFSARTLL